VFWVPKEARWSHLQDNDKQPTIGKLIDDAMSEIEKSNPGLKGVLPKDYNRPALDKVMLGELIDLVSGASRVARPRTSSETHKTKNLRTRPCLTLPDYDAR
jgi:type I restriction-modification system DNA methylase subunit